MGAMQEFRFAAVDGDADADADADADSILLWDRKGQAAAQNTLSSWRA
jgi:hypothetical protein